MMEKANTIIQRILSLKPSDKALAVSCYDLDEIKWHNEFKGETHNGEFEKWRERILITNHIESIYDHRNHMYLFRNKFSYK